ncbi:MAG: hypothetical protein ACR2NT_12100 [Acidimicrobiia bacterium]
MTMAEMTLLGEADPLGGLEVRANRERLHNGIVEGPPTRRRLHKRILILAIVLIATTGAIATARTGQRSQACWTVGDGTQWVCDSSELIRLPAADAEQVVDLLAVDIPLPPGVTFDRWKEHYLNPDAQTWESEIGIRGSLAFTAACEWTGYWLEAFDQGDSTTMAAAQEVLDAIPTWPAVVAVDGGGVADALQNRANGARTGDPSLFIDEYRINCT